ncbi:bifunctional DNA primase/polymerase [Candidatus Frankia alpina]|uniref:Bifunctional DNA primase/polymerase n=1 Tax=Candidatus Frankia alpina TaxID=2699483 RepID=A0A4S5CFZ2_9ACTN|nr:bifunctional DNA primase/polymerase [Candidatus Frankia alpina]THJ44737.1 bifunctional DNA primase/polymerase [Candidatus Frankia alpina]
MYPDQAPSVSLARRLSLRHAALFYAGLGWPVVPVASPDAAVARPGKQPLVRDWPSVASTSPGQIRAWWERWPDANVGIVTGPRSGLGVLDLDVDKGGVASLSALESRVGCLPGTVTVVTGSGGAHLYYRHPGVPLLSAADVYGPGLDVRGDGGLVVAPPSRHPCGHRYAWVGGAHGLCRETLTEYLADWPVGQLAQLNRPAPPLTSGSSPTAAPPRPHPAAGRVVPEAHRSARAEAILRGLCEQIASRPRGQRTRTVYWAGARVAEHAAAGVLIVEQAMPVLVSAGVAAGLTASEATHSATCGLRASEGLVGRAA